MGEMSFDDILHATLVKYRETLEANVFSPLSRTRMGLPKPREYTKAELHQMFKDHIEVRAREMWDFVYGNHECGEW